MSQPVVAISQARSARVSSTKTCLILMIAIVMAGEVFRLAQFLSCPSFWEDEIALLINTRDHSARDLPFERLTANGAQSPVAAPPLFLWATKWMGDRFDYSEWSVRLLPAICALLSLPLFALLAWQLVGPRAAVWAAGLLAVSDPLIFQAGDAKPYSGDVLMTIAIVLAARIGRADISAMRKLLCASCVAAMGLWISYSAVFVIAAVGLCLWEDMQGNKLQRLGRLALGASPAIASFLVVYFFSIRAQRDPHLDQYWIHLFPNLQRPLTIPLFVIGGTWELFHHQMYPIGPLLLAAAGLGIWQLRRQKNSRLMILLLAPVGLDLLASFLAQFPYGGTRLTLYLGPFLWLLCGIGAAGAIDLPGIWSRLLPLALASAPLTAAVIAVYGIFEPQNKGDFRDAMKFLVAHRTPGEEVYLVGNQTLGAAQWYWPDFDALTHTHLQQSAPIRGSNFWIVICYEPRKYKENKPAMTQPDGVVDESRSLHINGADVLWFSPRTIAAAAKD